MKEEENRKRAQFIMRSQQGKIQVEDFEYSAGLYNYTNDSLISNAYGVPGYIHSQ